MNLTGKIKTILANFYYIQDKNNKIWECFARGRLLKEGKLLFVGDDVEIETTSDKQGVITNLLSRRNNINKPPVANIDQVLIVFSSYDPEFDLYNLDRYLSFIKYELPKVTISLCINKVDLKKIDIDHIYKKINHNVFYISVKTKEGISELSKVLSSKTTVLTGPSGVGKSSLINVLNPNLNIKVGDLSSINRGKQTTRNVSLVDMNFENDAGFLVDTPGFSYFEFDGLDEYKILQTFDELNNLSCEYDDCLHLGEEGCNLAQAKVTNNISESRINSYLEIVNESKKEIIYGTKKETKLKTTGGKKDKNIFVPKLDVEKRSKSRKKEKQELLKLDLKFNENNEKT